MHKCNECSAYGIDELGFKDKEISVILSSLFGYSKNEVYKKDINKNKNYLLIC